ncbi:MAG: hypothetical protein GC190_22020 [Alphaproteobacteria bacterium]|nr:hypothetical protein [Alphaproteobacteria bacterium]
MGSAILGAIAKAVVGWLGSLLTGWMQRAADRQQGRKDQAAEDIAAAQKGDEDAKTIEDRNSGLSDSELDDKLRS